MTVTLSLYSEKQVCFTFYVNLLAVSSFVRQITEFGYLLPAVPRANNFCLVSAEKFNQDSLLLKVDVCRAHMADQKDYVDEKPAVDVFTHSSTGFPGRLLISCTSK